jgi:hypothetical protein
MGKNGEKSRGCRLDQALLPQLQQALRRGGCDEAIKEAWVEFG